MSVGENEKEGVMKKPDELLGKSDKRRRHAGVMIKPKVKWYLNEKKLSS